jgi:hypothetical protein
MFSFLKTGNFKDKEFPFESSISIKFGLGKETRRLSLANTLWRYAISRLPAKYTDSTSEEVVNKRKGRKEREKDGGGEDLREREESEWKKKRRRERVGTDHSNFYVVYASEFAYIT